jgi:hypothetical protein
VLDDHNETSVLHFNVAAPNVSDTNISWGGALLPMETSRNQRGAMQAIIDMQGCFTAGKDLSEVTAAKKQILHAA